jgi:hypothetical protein
MHVVRPYLRGLGSAHGDQGLPVLCIHIGWFARTAVNKLI